MYYGKQVYLIGYFILLMEKISDKRLILQSEKKNQIKFKFDTNQ